MGVMDSYKPPSAAPSSDVPSSGVMSTYKPPAPVTPSAPATQGWQSANEGVLPALRDYGLAGIDDLTLGAAKAHLPADVGQMIAQAHSNLGPMDPILSAAAYGFGPGKILGPIGRSLGGAGVGGVAAEGALAGGANAAVGTQDPSLGGVAKGAGQGAALGLGAGTVGSLLGKLLSSPGSVNPQAAEAATKQASKEYLRRRKEHSGEFNSNRRRYFQSYAKP